MDKYLDKSFAASAKMVDEKTMTLDHCISDAAPDRVGDDINQDGWDTKNYMLNPVVLDNHDYHKPPIGKCLKVYRKGNQMRAVTQFAPTPEGQKYFSLFKDGFMNAFSVGFIPKEYDINKTGGFHIDKQELLEYSVVTVPCNPRALKSFLHENKTFEEESLDMNKEEVAVLVKSAVEKSLGDLTKKHTDEITAKDAELAIKVKEVEDLAAKNVDLEAQVKSGAKISKASAGIITAISKGLKDHSASLDKFASDNCCAADPDGDGDKDEKEYSNEAIEKLVAENIKKILDEAEGK